MTYIVIPLLNVSADHEEVEEISDDVRGGGSGEDDAPGLEGVVVLDDGPHPYCCEVGCQPSRHGVGYPKYGAGIVGCEVGGAGEVARG